MVEEEIKVFKNYMKRNMLRNATKSIKYIFELLSVESDEIKEVYINQVHSIAEEYGFRFDLEIEGKLIMAINWYQDDVRIMPNDGPITPMVPKKTPKARRNPISGAFRHEVFVRDNYRCLECGATNMDRILEIDHIVPVSQGGTDEMKNLQTLCMICNRAKSNRAWESLPENIEAPGENLN